MGGRSSTHTVQTQVVYRPDPVVAQKLAATEQKLVAIEEQARKAGDPKLYSTNAANLLTNFVEHLHELNITEAIQKAPGERHIGVIGDISCGKSTFLNTMFDLKLPVALGHCTTKCEPVHRIKKTSGDVIYWDVPGKSGDFRFYKLENLAFVKSLDTCLVLYDNDVAMIGDVLRVVEQLCPGRVVAIRTKLDQYNANNARTPVEEKIRDSTQITGALGKAVPLYFVSSHNIKNGTGDRYDWDALKAHIMS